MYAVESMGNEVYKLFAFTDGTVTWSMSEISLERHTKYQITIEKIAQSNTIWNIFVPIKYINLIKNVKY